MARKTMSVKEANKRRNERTNKYKKEHYDRVVILPPKGKKMEYSAYAQSLNMSMTQFMMMVVDEWVKNHKDRPTYTIK